MHKKALPYPWRALKNSAAFSFTANDYPEKISLVTATKGMVL
jgi:hypothetical protein